jgi:hypothetical protein
MTAATAALTQGESGGSCGEDGSFGCFACNGGAEVADTDTAISQVIGIMKPNYSSHVFLLRSSISDMLGFCEGLVATSGISMVRVNCTMGMYKPWAMAVYGQHLKLSAVYFVAW